VWRSCCTSSGRSEEVRQNWIIYSANGARDGVMLSMPPQPVVRDLTAVKDGLSSNVDAIVAAIYGRWLRFEAEYIEREAAARAFAAAGYEGEPGVWVMSFADPAGLSPAVAADRIIEQADKLRQALQDLGAQRMAKYRIQSAPDEAAAQGEYAAIIAAVDGIAAGLE
jgi:hypothetical protein